MVNGHLYRYHPVWDPLLRALHWWNAVAMLLQITLGGVLMAFGEAMKGSPRESLETAHSVVGYAFAAGLLSRVLWLFFGPPVASWRDLLPITPRQRAMLVDTLKYYLSGFTRTSPLYLAHNPLAGVVYAGFFVLAALQVATGITILNTPADQREGLFAADLHEAGFFLLILYVMAHVPAIFIHEWAERQGLIGSMVHGEKAFTDEEWDELSRHDENLLAKGGPNER